MTVRAFVEPVVERRVDVFTQDTLER